MKKLLFLTLLLPFFCTAQERLAGHLAVNDRNSETGEKTLRTYWQVLERATPRHTLNTFFSISCINDVYYLDLKVVERGEMFVIARDAPFMLHLENDKIVTLHNTAYTHSCLGCGARDVFGRDAPGATLSFKLNKDDLKQLMHSYVNAIRLENDNSWFEAPVKDTHSELLMSELWFIYHANNEKIKAGD